MDEIQMNRDAIASILCEKLGSDTGTRTRI
jgi:hypothetical protein